jgi:hypothetical protein
MNLEASYIEKWSGIVPQSETIDRDLATSSIKQTYHFLQLPEPIILFSSQPNQSIDTFLKYKLVESDEYLSGFRVQPDLSRKQAVKLKHQLGTELAETFTGELLLHLGRSIGSQIGNDIESQLWVSVENTIRKRISPGYSKRLRNFISCRDWICYVCKFDLCIQELNVAPDPQRWAIVQNLVTSCDWFIPFTNVCLIGDCAVTKFF